MHKSRHSKKVIILGIDAMDPKITERLIQEGKLPNLSYLKTNGTYLHLATTIPAESVVAWTSFATGLNPGSHGIFDFIMRNPKNYLPYLSLNEISTEMQEPKIQIRRKGKVFWNILSQNKIPCFIFFCPNTFPAQPILGKILSGMGVPDLYGTIGRFSFYTSQLLTDEDKDSRGKIIHVEPKNNIIEAEIYGPKVMAGTSITESTIPLKITLNPSEKNMSLEFQGNKVILKEGSWSSWQEISFRISLFRKAYGIVRFYLKSIKPDFELYLSPVNFNPKRPLFPISYPKDYSAKLAKSIGLYYTQGIPQDTWPLTENRVDEKAFLEETDEILSEKEKILNKELKEFKGGLFFFYFDTLDMIQHMFWRYLDPKHPLYEKNPLYQDTIFKYYEKIDQIIGEVLKSIDSDTTVIILSDHGFNSFRRSAHLNRWLLENGYLFLKEGMNESGEFFENVDWSKTKAYALGFGGIYLNRAGREYYGIVSESEAGDLKQAIIKGLKEFKDSKDGGKVIENVYDREDVLEGPYVNDAWDLFAGFNVGYRASWQTALGGVPRLLIEDNKRKWSGDHLMDSALVPGVIFVNRKIELSQPHITDIASFVLGLFNTDKPSNSSH